jgi:hypothetical protein
MINLNKELEFIKKTVKKDNKFNIRRHFIRNNELTKKETIINKLPNELKSQGIKQYNDYDYYKDNYN